LAGVSVDEEPVEVMMNELTDEKQCDEAEAIEGDVETRGKQQKSRWRSAFDTRQHDIDRHEKDRA
jgi:hypothetical protein